MVLTVARAAASTGVTSAAASMALPDTRAFMSSVHIARASAILATSCSTSPTTHIHTTRAVAALSVPTAGLTTRASTAMDPVSCAKAKFPQVRVSWSPPDNRLMPPQPQLVAFFKLLSMHAFEDVCVCVCVLRFAFQVGGSLLQAGDTALLCFNLWSRSLEE